jgi:hypothetical protein
MYFLDFTVQPSPLKGNLSYNLCKNGFVVCGPVRGRAPSRAPKLLVISGQGAYNGYILCHNDYKPRCRCFDLGVELSCLLIGLVVRFLSPAQLEWVRHYF